MKAARIRTFGSPEVIEIQDLEVPIPTAGGVLVRVQAAGVGPWDSWVRSGQSVRVPLDALPVTLGSDLAGTVVSVGPDVTAFVPGDMVFGVTNANFCGAYAQFAVANASMLARMPRTLDFVAAAAAPVVAVTAWQMLFDHAQLGPGQTVLVLGGSGSVGTCAIQLAHGFGAHVIATTTSDSHDDILRRGAAQVIDARDPQFDAGLAGVDVVIDTVGGDLQIRSLRVQKPRGLIVSAVSTPDATLTAEAQVRGTYFIVAVDSHSACLAHIAAEMDRGAPNVPVGSVSPLLHAREAHRMRPKSRQQVREHRHASSRMFG
jgi:NADPH:quinone reductase-like Zn-dependent oxidoreductase